MLFCSLVLVALSFLLTSENTLLIRDGNNLRVHNTYATSPGAALQEAGITVGAMDTMLVPFDKLDGVGEVFIDRNSSMYIDIDGERTVVESSADTVGSLLERTGVKLGIRDRISPPLDTPTSPGMTVTVLRATPAQDNIPHLSNALLIRDSNSASEASVLPAEAAVATEPLNALKTSKKRVQTAVTNPAAAAGAGVSMAKPENPGLIEGTEGGGTITTADGTVLKYKKMYYVQATAYTTEGYSQKRNALGKIAREGTIAVDPRLIPLKSKVYVASRDGTSWIYGQAICEDTGGAIKGKIIDVFFDTLKECYQFGRRNAVIYVLE